MWRPKGNPPYNKLTRKRLALIERDGENCYLCGLPFSMKRPPSLEHVIPKAKGGGNGMNNLKLAHSQCNYKKGCFILPNMKAQLEHNRTRESDK